jgi:hypothetical protein
MARRLPDLPPERPEPGPPKPEPPEQRGGLFVVERPVAIVGGRYAPTQNFVAPRVVVLLYPSDDPNDLEKAGFVRRLEPAELRSLVGEPAPPTAEPTPAPRRGRGSR